MPALLPHVSTCQFINAFGAEILLVYLRFPVTAHITLQVDGWYYTRGSRSPSRLLPNFLVALLMAKVPRPRLLQLPLEIR